LVTSKNAGDRKVTDKVKVFWPNQAGPDARGVHVNVSGAAVTKSAKNKAEAIRLLEFLVGVEAQKIYASVGFEYPVRKGVARGAVVAGMGDFKMDNLALENLGRHNAEAVRIFDRVGWR